jgi:O-methyltransferase involved in polyketide biosynthesis
MTGMSVAVELSGVPETLLWTLYHRTQEARRPDAVLADPLAVELVDRIDYPFSRFGATAWRARWQALRALRFDIEVRRFMQARPGCTVVALGEGLETQFWRVDDGRVRWVTVELPETVSAVGSLLPASPRRRVIARSALDLTWLDEIAGLDVMVTAQGLLMYLARDDADGLIRAIASRLPGGAMVFDTVPFWASKATTAGKMRTAEGYKAPPMPWGSGRGEAARVAALSPAIRDVHRLLLPRADDRAFGVRVRLAVRFARRRVGVTYVCGLSGRFRGAPPSSARPLPVAVDVRHNRSRWNRSSASARSV